MDHYVQYVVFIGGEWAHHSSGLTKKLRLLFVDSNLPTESVHLLLEACDSQQCAQICGAGAKAPTDPPCSLMIVRYWTSICLTGFGFSIFANLGR